MASSLFALLDDIATGLDDVALLTKVAARKTAGVLADDLALNAQQVAGICANRELPVVWAVARGSAINKAILVPAALVVSALAPWAVTPLLMIGGAFLCYEGFEKLAHRFLHSEAEDRAHHDALAAALANPAADMAAIEWCKVFGSWDEDTHWTNVVPEDEHDRVRADLLAHLRMAPEDWEEYWTSITDYRNKVVAHHDLAATVLKYPHYDVALQAAHFMFGCLRDFADPDELGGIPTDLDRWSDTVAGNMSAIVRAAFAASAPLGSNIRGK